MSSVLRADIIDDVREAVSRQDFATAETRIQAYRKQQGAKPEMLEALSWMARGALDLGHLKEADAYATQTYQLCVEALKKRPVDADPYLPIALGAAIEVHSQVLARQGARPAAVQYLRRELLAYRTSSLSARIQKNINILTLEGALAPELDERQYTGGKPTPLAALRGKPVLLFFWAHWCGDCRAEVPLLAEIRKEFGAKGLVLTGPTRLYGYTAANDKAPPAEELKFIEAVRNRFYAPLADVPMPINTQNFLRYGASTTPTIVLIDRAGIVRLYHPGAMDWNELRAAVEKITS